MPCLDLNLISRIVRRRHVANINQGADAGIHVFHILRVPPADSSVHEDALTWLRRRVLLPEMQLKRHELFRSPDAQTTSKHMSGS